MSSASRRGAAVLMALIVVTGAGCAATVRESPGRSDGPTTVQAGAPGEPSRVVTPGAASSLQPRHAPEDVRFMRDMIVHHAQAVTMTDMVPERTQNEAIRLLARRIEVSQADEMALMRRWLAARGEPVADEHAHHHGGHAAHTGMPGMLSDAQLAQLAAARDAEFDRLFLELMITHHEGALVMVRELFATEHGGNEVEIFDFASHVDADQQMEIARMRRMLAAISGSAP